MFYFKLAIKNLARNKRRSLLTLSAVIIACIIITFAQCYFEGVLDNMSENYIHFETGHIKINTDEYVKRERLFPLDEAVFGINELEAKINTFEEVELVTGRIKFGVLLNVNNSNFRAMGIGMEPNKETNILPWDELIKEGNYLNPDKQEMIIGSQLADKLNVAVNDTITILTSTAYGSLSALNFHIVGIFEFGMAYLDKSVFYIPLKSAQYLLDLEDAATEIVIMTDNKHNAEILALQIEKQLTDDYSVRSWNKVGALFSSIETRMKTMHIMYFFFLFTAALIIANTMLMSILERTREIGMLMAMGMRPNNIVRLFLTEGIVIGFVGGIIGCILGTIIVITLEHTGIPVGNVGDATDMPFGDTLYPKFFILAPIYALILGVITSILASLYPAKKAASLVPTEALRAS